jgi:proteasome lid subunit RPN8/RPN11
VIAAPAALLATIRRGAEDAYPEECCGLLIGRDGDAGALLLERLAPSANLAEDRRRRFEIDPALYWDLRRTLAGSRERLLGLYHSHPDGSATPSTADVAAAWEVDWIWLIVPVAAGRAGIPLAHRLVAAGGPFEPVPLQVG